ncbi:hypothetical protein Scep_012167 [Stephania cephalantha]|uniref:Uncharacterized protein n=1 Tax=Stephania cephalantha TaxID=152367 RepID=A0AAP0P780_9MAGN
MQPGHKSSDYPPRKAIHMVEREEEDDNIACAVDGDGDEDEYEYNENDGQNYVVRRMMFSPNHEDQTQRRQLFKARENTYKLEKVDKEFPLLSFKGSSKAKDFEVEKFPSPSLDDMFDRLHDSKVFTKINLYSKHHKTHIQSRDEWKTTFKIQDGIFEWLVILFELTEVSTTSIKFVKTRGRVFLSGRE